MKKKVPYRFQRLLSVLLTVAMLLSLPPAAWAEDLPSDIEGHWAQEVMQAFIDEGYIQGTAEGKYLPDDAISRAQFAVIVNRIVGYTEESTTIAQYSDVSAEDWYYHDLAKAVAAGYMTGTTQRELSPERNLTREQAMVMLARILGVEETGANLTVLDKFQDASSISDYARKAAAAIVQKGYVYGDNQNNLMPQKILTRTEAAAMLDRSKAQLLTIGSDKAVEENKTPLSVSPNTGGGSSSSGSSSSGDGSDGGGSSGDNSGGSSSGGNNSGGDNEPSTPAETPELINKEATGLIWVGHNLLL